MNTTKPKKVTELAGWATMTEAIRAAIGTGYSEPDLDKIMEAAAAENYGPCCIEVSGHLTASGNPVLVDVPEDVIDWVSHEGE